MFFSHFSMWKSNDMLIPHSIQAYIVRMALLWTINYERYIIYHFIDNIISLVLVGFVCNSLGRAVSKLPSFFMCLTEVFISHRVKRVKRDLQQITMLDVRSHIVHPTSYIYLSLYFFCKRKPPTIPITTKATAIISAWVKPPANLSFTLIFSIKKRSIPFKIK